MTSCKNCGLPLQPRKIGARGRPKLYCSPECRAQYIGRETDFVDRFLRTQNQYFKFRGLSHAWVEIRRILGEEQNWTCAICSIRLDPSKGEAHLDHCHKTNKIRGVLCYNCNPMLGFAKENRTTLLRAIQYLRKHQETTQ